MRITSATTHLAALGRNSILEDYVLPRRDTSARLDITSILLLNNAATPEISSYSDEAR